NQGVGFPLDTNGLAQNRTFLSLNDGASFQPAGPPAGTTAANAVIRAVVTSATSLPSVEVSPSSIDFGNVNVNASADRLITVRNTGTAILNVTGITSTNPRFSVAAISSSFIVAPGGQEAIPIRFSPAAAGNQTSLLTLSSNDPAKASVTVQLIGTGSGTAANRVVRIGAAGGAPGGTVAVPIELTSQGDENALGFSLTFDPSILSNPQAAPGADAAGSMLNTNLNQAAQGRAGIALARPSGQTFSAGTRQIVVVTFSIAAGATAPATGIGFGDQPVPREVVNAGANALPTAFTGGAIAIAQGFEADVAPRPNGNGSVSIADWVQIGRFVAGLDGISPGSEYQRADCAPRDSKGNGNLTVADWVQAGRYAAGLDPTVAAGGPTGPGSSSTLARVRFAGRFAAADRTVRLINSSRRDGSIA
ncbi:MAG: choice-of-anchor D domain-containing protein, partial [Pseudomonadota bacterium]